MQLCRYREIPTDYVDFVWWIRRKQESSVDSTNDDRNYIGVYPMKGKIFNVRGESFKKINENKEIIEIKKIMGLETGKTYTNVNDLRYGKIVFMTDQDLDGSHIKGLCINFIAYLYYHFLKFQNLSVS